MPEGIGPWWWTTSDHWPGSSPATWSVRCSRWPWPTTDHALAVARETDPDLVVLDLGLPGIDGLEVCRQLRGFSDAYVVMLTARDTELDTVVGLSVGADDYVTKPFSPRELIARIRAMLRRPRTTPAAPAAAGRGGGESPPRVFGPLRIDVAAREVFLDDAPVMLTRTEFDVLAALSSRPGVVLHRRKLIDTVWGESWVGNEHLVDVHVAHLRAKLGDDPAAPRYVATVRGIGYRMGPADDRDAAPPALARHAAGSRHRVAAAAGPDPGVRRGRGRAWVDPRSWARRCSESTCTAPGCPPPRPNSSTPSRPTARPPRSPSGWPSRRCGRGPGGDLVLQPPRATLGHRGVRRGDRGRARALRHSGLAPAWVLST